MRSERFIKRFLAVIFGYALAVISAIPLWSQPTYPTKPINLLIHYAPGGPADIAIRFVAGKAEKYLGQPFAISNNGAGSGVVATGGIAKKPPDGYNLLADGVASVVRVPHSMTVRYKSDDLTFIMHYAAPESGLLVKGDAPWNTMKEFIEYAKKNPGLEGRYKPGAVFAEEAFRKHYTKHIFTILI
jgi:tripartite-type tricarboxylate transporter receptor subunit TctC